MQRRTRMHRRTRMQKGKYKKITNQSRISLFQSSRKTTYEPNRNKMIYREKLRNRGLRVKRDTLARTLNTLTKIK